MKAWYPTKRDAPLIDRRIQQQRIKKLGFCRKYCPTIPKKRRDKYTRRVLGKLGKTKGSGDENKREKLRVGRYTRSVRSAFACKTVFTRLAEHTRHGSISRDLIEPIVFRARCNRCASRTSPPIDVEKKRGKVEIASLFAKKFLAIISSVALSQKCCLFRSMI